MKLAKVVLARRVRLAKVVGDSIKAEGLLDSFGSEDYDLELDDRLGWIWLQRRGPDGEPFGPREGVPSALVLKVQLAEKSKPEKEKAKP